MANKCRFNRGNIIHIVPGDKTTCPAAGQSLTPTSCNFPRTVVMLPNDMMFPDTGRLRNLRYRNDPDQGVHGPRYFEVIVVQE